ncbi:hypothetical protein [Methylovirgula sp. 4M-Z18]|uniref:hypothetical protein n=1 Tax=Methylovirgula sp. 4M-Z18 TaxID=2293567 RepID=UPI000E2E54C1|nr:hypothetical protein [Methylovirgula sp. 4M-Z18]RFB78960.1 hypothetical protein DYH55_14110 [Methylovirgula sp. 4M-Z18]
MLTQSTKTHDRSALEFVLGRDHEGHWVVRETRGLCGGLFVSKDEAIRYTRSEGTAETNKVRIVPDDEAIDFSV